MDSLGGKELGDRSLLLLNLYGHILTQICLSEIARGCVIESPISVLVACDRVVFQVLRNFRCRLLRILLSNRTNRHRNRLLLICSLVSLLQFYFRSHLDQLLYRSCLFNLQRLA